MITSTKNPRIIDVRKLDHRKHRQRQDRFLVEGLQLLALAMEMQAKAPGKIVPRDIFYCADLFTGDTAPRLLAQLTAAGGAPVPVAEHVLNAISDRDTSQGLAVTFQLSKVEWPIEALLAAIKPGQSPKLVLVLDKLQDPGNLGTLIRTADAAGVTAIILLEPCVDAFDPKTVRGTMGSIFTVPFARVQHPAELLPRLAGLGYRLVGADAPRGQTVWNSTALAGSVGLVLGNEARGLDPELQPHIAGYVSLPLLGHAESLNVSVAGGVLMYEWLRVNE
ncbi:MAG: 23S rRNA (guanosine-2'-O-)-methyltransferase RlmB [Anaerolineae bacterium]|nr:23S rRNA (guanosine-2'-O-)-methyltransferase RlmB [Anaerolineae bacterium]